MDPFQQKRHPKANNTPPFTHPQQQVYSQPFPTQQNISPPQNFPFSPQQQQLSPQQFQSSQSYGQQTPNAQYYTQQPFNPQSFQQFPNVNTSQQQYPYSQQQEPSFHGQNVNFSQFQQSLTKKQFEAPSGQLDTSNASAFYSTEISWKEAFGSGGLPGDPPLLQELGINLPHILSKSTSVLNPFKQIDKHLMDDTDLAGPLLFCVLFPIFLLFSGKVHFDAIYGIALIGMIGTYLLLNVMSTVPISIAQSGSVLGYCMLPMLMLAFMSMFARLTNPAGYGIASGCIVWCTGVASKMFVAMLGMKNQTFLVAYPIFLFYAAFALMTVF